MMIWVSVSLIRELIPTLSWSYWEGVFMLGIVIDAFRPPLLLATLFQLFMTDDDE
jgi:hypothetical protein